MSDDLPATAAYNDYRRLGGDRPGVFYVDAMRDELLTEIARLRKLDATYETALRGQIEDLQAEVKRLQEAARWVLVHSSELKDSPRWAERRDA